MEIEDQEKRLRNGEGKKTNAKHDKYISPPYNNSFNSLTHPVFLMSFLLYSICICGKNWRNVGKRRGKEEEEETEEIERRAKNERPNYGRCKEVRTMCYMQFIEYKP